MTKSERTQKIEEAGAILRELKAAEVDPKRVPKAGDVWELIAGNVIKTLEGWEWTNFDQAAELPDDMYTNAGTYLGTFDEVYVLRSEVEKDYVSKKDLKGLQTDSVRYNVRLAEVIHAIDLLIE